MNDELFAAAATNLADWHDLSVQALGLRTTREAGLWWCDDAAPPHFFTGVTLDSADFADEQQAIIERKTLARPGQALVVCDCFGVLDLTSCGYKVTREAAWMVRQPAEPERGAFPEGLVIRRVVTDAHLADWEAASVAGFAMPYATDWESAPGPGLLSDPSLQVFLGSVDGTPASGSMALIGERVVGVYAVSTIPGFRRRGIGEWLTWRAVLGRPNLPAILQPSDEARSLYRRMGFEEAGRFVVWTRPA